MEKTHHFLHCRRISDELSDCKNFDGGKAQKAKDDLNTVLPDFNKAVDLAHIEYGLYDHSTPNYGVFDYKADAMDIYSNPNLSSIQKIGALKDLNVTYKNNLDSLRNNVDSVNKTVKDINKTVFVLQAVGTSLFGLSFVLFIIGAPLTALVVAAPLGIILLAIAALSFIASVVLLSLGGKVSSVANKISDTIPILNVYVSSNEGVYNESVVYIDGLLDNLYKSVW